MTLPSVDIIIPTKNEHLAIGQCLEALQQQDYPQDRISIYVVDSSSDDRTIDACQGSNAAVHSCKLNSAASQRNYALKLVSGDLCGFLDAHSRPENTWVSQMVSVFNSPLIAAAQGSIGYVSADRHTRRLNACGIFASEQTFSENTVGGKNTPLPWIVTGNAFYRRSVLDQIGLFDELLCASEDLELSWRAVLAGYLLIEHKEARLVHYNTDNPYAFLKKQFRFGRSSVQIARKFGLKTGATKNKGTIHDWLVAAVYEAGRRWELATGASPSPAQMHVLRVPADRRRWFDWDQQRCLRLSPAAIYWHYGEETRVIDLRSHMRSGLTGSGALIFQQVLDGTTRSAALAKLMDEYAVAEMDIAEELDGFLAELLDAGILESKPISTESGGTSR